MTLMISTFWPPRSQSSTPVPGTCSPSSARCRPVSWRIHTMRRPASSDWTVWAFIPITKRRSGRSCSAPPARPDLKIIQVSVFDGFSGHDTESLIHIVASWAALRALTSTPTIPLVSIGRHGDSYRAGGPAVPVTDTDVRITDDGTTIQSAKRLNILNYSLHQGDLLSVALFAGRYVGIELQRIHRRTQAQWRGVALAIFIRRAAPGGLPARFHALHRRPRHSGDCQRRHSDSNFATMYTRRDPAAPVSISTRG